MRYPEFVNIREFYKLAKDLESGHPSKDSLRKISFILSELSKIDSTICGDGFPWHSEPFKEHPSGMKMEHRIISNADGKIGTTTCPDIATSIASIVNAFVVCERIARDKGARTKTQKRRK